jgi:signal transduction histidine kinase
MVLKNHPHYKIIFNTNDLPDNPEKMQIKGNAHLLKTALVNLFDNGCKFSQNQTVHIELSFTPDEVLVLEIKDSGPGISEEEKILIFEPFFRSSKTNSIKGSGIGLSLVKSIFTIHHAELTVESTEQVGTNFIIRFKNW